MTSPGPISHSPQPRRFGSVAGTSPSSSLAVKPASRSNTPRSSTPTLVPPPIEPRRTRSSSSASVVSQDGSEVNNSFGKAQAWLSTWAPRGEGRTREFLAHTVNGVASVASTVSSGLGGTVNTLEQRAGLGSRPNSFHAVGTGSGNVNVNGNGNGLGGGGSTPTLVGGDGLRQVVSPPGPIHTASTPTLTTTQMANGRKTLMPANASRLASTPPSGSGIGPGLAKSPPSSGFHRPSLSLSNASSSSSTPTVQGPGPSRTNTGSSQTGPHHAPHGSSHLNPNPHGKRGSFSNPAAIAIGNHTRSPSMSYAPSASPTPSRSSSTANTNGGIWRSAGMPYKVGFQPAGVKNDRTSEFHSDRKRMAEEREKEEGRLGRRWAKLVDLHFNPTAPNIALPPGMMPRSTSTSSTFTLNGTGDSKDKRRSILTLDGALDAMKAKDMWKGLKGVANPPDQLEAARKRVAEQAIVKWEDDSEVRKCRICQSSFSLSNRKHHCRVCGRIVCSLPPTPSTLLAVQIQLFSPPAGAGAGGTDEILPPGTRRDKCSLLLVADWKSGRGEEVEEGFVGWMKVDLDEDGGKSSKGKGKGEGPPTEVQVRGVRVCKDCWGTVSRKQKIADRQRVSGFARLYGALRTIQHEIEAIMGEFEDQMEDLVNHDPPIDPPPDLVLTHKTLMALLGQYEHLTKRISGLPVDSQGTGGQATVQGAVGRGAAAFLTMGMLKVQALPRYQKRLAEGKRTTMEIMETTLADQLRLQGIEDGASEDVAVMLQPLLEQEAQLESYIADANAQRKYEDGKALQEALNEIRAEIGSITSRM